MRELVWYSMNIDLQVEKHNVMDLEGALRTSSTAMFRSTAYADRMRATGSCRGRFGTSARIRSVRSGKMTGGTDPLAFDRTALIC